MEGFLQQLVRLSVFVYAAASMLSVGLGHTVADVVGPLRHPGRVARVLLTNFLLVPLLGFLLFRLFSLDRPYAIGLFLVACAAGAPFLIKLTMAARGDVASPARCSSCSSPPRSCSLRSWCRSSSPAPTWTRR